MEKFIEKKHHYQSGKFIFGILIVFTGVILLGTNFGWINPSIKHVLFTWTMILIVK